MNRKVFATLLLACSVGAAACDRSPTDGGNRPQYDGIGRRTTTTTTTTTAASDSTKVGGAIGDPCDPATYAGPYRCVPDEHSASGYVIAY